MAKLSFIQKDILENLFQMKGGYVLDFSNREFENFIEDVLGYRVYEEEKYTGLSKAKILREIFNDEEEPFVGKLLIELTNYMKYKDMVNSQNINYWNSIQDLGLTFLGKFKNSTSNSQKKSQYSYNCDIIDYDKIKYDLLSIEQEPNSQQKGYSFEKFLFCLFESFHLSPHSSFKTEFNQLDGSFLLNGITILIEAKYRKAIPSKDDLILFENKLNKTSNLTRGVFITLTPFEKKTLDYYLNLPKRIIIVTVEELYLMCEYKISLIDLLNQKFRKLDETGKIFYHLLNLDLIRR